jgi:hypothetical protein
VSDSPEQLNTTPAITRVWFDRLETVLREEAQLAGLLGHGGLIGSGREFMVRRVLRSVLPPAVHIGSGVIVGPDAARSKQTDIVIYDPRFPFLEVEAGVGLYYVEGVIATVEVKSRLTTEKLKEGLENCAAVLSLSGHVKSFYGMNREAARLQKEGFSPKDAQGKVKAALKPKTCVFAFTSDLSTKTIAAQVVAWYDARGESESAYDSGLPAIIATQNTVGLLADGWVLIDPGDAAAEFDKEFGPGGWLTVMGFWPVPRQFGWLALRLVHDVCERFAPIHPRLHTEFGADAYLPAAHYFEQDMKDKEGVFIPWTKRRITGAAPLIPSTPAPSGPTDPARAPGVTGSGPTIVTPATGASSADPQSDKPRVDST